MLNAPLIYGTVGGQGSGGLLLLTLPPPPAQQWLRCCIHCRRHRLRSSAAQPSAPMPALRNPRAVTGLLVTVFSFGMLALPVAVAGALAASQVHWAFAKTMR